MSTQPALTPCPICNHPNRTTAHFCGNCRAPLLLQNKYRIVRRLGRGGFGSVFLAEQLNLGGAPCAIKELTTDPNATPQQEQQAAAQFQFEASTLARLNHPALPRVTDFFQEGHRYYLVMEYVEGETLEERLLHIGRPLSEHEVLQWTAELCDALTYLHTRPPSPVIHRDVKPGNIKITPEGKLKLLDFGIAKLLETGGPGTGTAARAVSPPYAPIEQYGRGTDPRSDVYALGVTLYQLLTNHLPPEAPDRPSEETVPPRQLNPALSPNTEAVILRAMAERRADRFQSADEMRQALHGTRTQPLSATLGQPIKQPAPAPAPYASPVFSPIVLPPTPHPRRQALPTPSAYAPMWVRVGIVIIVALLIVFGILNSRSSNAPASGPTVRNFTVTATEFRFEPSTLTASVGDEIRITLTNRGVVQHSWVLLNATTPIAGVKTEPGETQTLSFTATTVATYEFICDIPGHKEAGMVGTLVVQ